MQTPDTRRITIQATGESVSPTVSIVAASTDAWAANTRM
jgi:hypothetical protein